MKRKRLKLSNSLILSLCISLAIIALRLGGLFEQTELKLFDSYYKFAPIESRDERVILVGVTETDIDKLKTNRLSDYQLYQILSEIKKGKPAAVGIDIFRDHPVPPNYWELQELQKKGIDALSSPEPFGHKEFLSIFTAHPNFFAVGKQSGIEGDKNFDLIDPPPIPQKQIADAGVILDADGNQRRALLYPVTKAPAIPNLAWALAEEYLNQKNARIDGVDRYGDYHLKVNNTIFWQFRNYHGAYVTADEGGYQTLINWRKSDFEQISISDILEKKVSLNRFKDKIVIIGAYAPSLNDQFLTPLNSEWFGPPRQINGIEAIAQVSSYILSAVLDGRPVLQTWREPWISLAILASSGLTGYFFTRISTNRLNLALLVVFFIDIALLCAFFISLYFGYLQPVIPLLLSITLTAIAHDIFLSSLKRKDDYKHIKALNQKLEDMIERRQYYRLAYNSVSEIGEKLIEPLQSLLLINDKWLDYEKELSEFIKNLNVSKIDQYKGNISIARLMIDLTRVKDYINFVSNQLSLYVPTLSHLNNKVNLIEFGMALTEAIESICNIYLDARDFQIDIKDLFIVKDSRIYQHYIESYRLKNLLMRIIDQPLRQCYFEDKKLPNIEIEINGGEQLIDFKVSINYRYIPNNLTVYFCEELLNHNNGKIEILHDQNYTIWNIDLYL